MTYYVRACHRHSIPNWLTGADPMYCPPKAEKMGHRVQEHTRPHQQAHPPVHRDGIDHRCARPFLILAPANTHAFLAPAARRAASLAGISLALVYLPQHPPYYQVAGLILAKTYSNSMIAALNSRVKVLPNACVVSTTTTGRPVWNEEVDVDDMNSRGLEFNTSVGSETGSGSAHTV